MSHLLELTDPTFCVAGTVGPPGKRTFYLQAAEGDRLVTLHLEKQQIAALATYLAELLSDLSAPDEPVPTHDSLLEPVVAEWAVGSIGVGYRSDTDRIVLALEELTAEPLDDQYEDDLGRARIHLTRGQTAHLVSLGAMLVAAGRPQCPLCSRPVDAEGHTCIKSNGHGHS